MKEPSEPAGDNGRDNLEKTESVLMHYLERTPLSYALWRSLEYQQLLGLPFDDPVLDMGCGDGIFSSILFTNRIAIGMDLDYREVTLAREYATHESMVAADARTLPFASQSFSTVFSNCVIEHIPDPERVISEVTRVLAPGGLFIFTVPTEHFTPHLFFTALLRKTGLSFLANRYGGFVNRMLKHINMFTADQWTGMVQDAGLSIEISRQFIGPRSIAIFDLFLPLSYVSFFYRRILGRWAVFPGQRLMLAPMIFRFSKKYLREQSDTGACVLITARKPG